MEDYNDEVTEEQVKAIQKMADDSARSRGEVPPSEIPDTSWVGLFE